MKRFSTLLTEKKNIVSQWGAGFRRGSLAVYEEQLREYQRKPGNLYNLEATPAGGATHRFAKEDQKIFPGIIQAGTRKLLTTTNSSQIPVEHTGDAFKALELQDKLQTKYTGERFSISIWEKESATPSLAAN